LGADQRGRKVCAGVCVELANRGIKDVLIVCWDGLTGFPEAIETTWLHSTVQTSSVQHGVARGSRWLPAPPWIGPVQTCCI
jgi:transposase-like protein